MRAVLLLVFACACNAIDGADQYKKSGDDDSSTCQPSCIATSGNCLADCATTRDACKSGSCNPGCQNKCDGTYGNCTSACVTTCTGCSCSQTDCENATPPLDAGTDG